MKPTLDIRRLDADEDLKHCIKIRHDAFVIGQKVPIELEVDGEDENCWHYLARHNDKPVATARIYFPEKDTVKIQRVAVLPELQGMGIGHALMLYILADMMEHASIAKLDSQTHALKFYEKLGFAKIGEEFMDAGIPHYTMTCKIK